MSEREPVPERTPRPRRGHRGAKRSRRSRWMWRLLRIAVLAAVPGLILAVWLDVSLARRFEGRLWQIPSRVYSDALAVSVGDHLSKAVLTHRLDRSGYARVAEAPEQPGQYRDKGRSLQVHVRPFSMAGRESTARRIELRFDGDRVLSIGEIRGRNLQQVWFEPELLATIFGPRHEERQPISIEEAPESLRNAVLAAEDVRFYDHRGVDLRGVVRAAFANVAQGRIAQGGSTITQQTVKNLFLDQERTWWRKIREAVMALLLDARYSKDRIFEVYLNEVYLGQRGSVAICGVQAAARFYLGRDVHDLSLAESALLAGMIQSPGRYNPFADAKRAVERRNLVLDTMARLEWIKPPQRDRAQAEKLRLASGEAGFSRASYVVDFVQTEIATAFPAERLRQEGLQIFSTVDTVLQERAEQALHDGLARLEQRGTGRRKGELQGSVIVVQPATGAILALVGGRDYAQSQFNRAVQARRQPGSCFKPFVYAAGFEAAVRGDGGLTPATILEDEPLEMVSGGKPWRPSNYDGTFRGNVTVREALRDSLNVPTVRAALDVGLKKIASTAHKLGIDSELSEFPSLALGAAEVTPLELATAYATLARQGRSGPLRVIREVADAKGQALARQDPSWSRAISPAAAFLVSDILRDVLREGTARSAAALGYAGDAAGKTGTTDDTRDSWFVGYTPDLLALVWVGYDDGTSTGLTGATGALPIWVDLMRGVGSAERNASFSVPPGVVQVQIDPTTGYLATGGCPEPIDEWFPEGAEPTELCPDHSGRIRRWFHKLFERRGAETI